ncbi:precorrin-2 dehydrogenase/sirohydrochlorin ferrochelatase [Caulobacter ginsengisoli]|uniref:precorrin-2 dehydrogenase n=1 Tax=Caulobacter ginsengisoli TaxID=400775 RepID=A0ABU0IVD3_9CAUL|nr:NAD(P)-dependent oxidoreductase [Caulobacter ginsengisoli]MDQ0464912.1 precorrin-2 dehydrogenase/sirohydrochlorin ferrochelatase [Caulobacter ginsengisoli]
MDAFPAFFPLAGRKVVIAGTGEAADAKARLFDGSPAVLVRAEGTDAFLIGTYAGALLAFIAGDDLFVQSAASAARGARALVNVVDRPDLSDFHTPALVDRGEVVAAIGTNGSAPMLASLLRNDIEARIPEGTGRVAALMRIHQAAVRAVLPDQADRRNFLREQLSGPAAQKALDGDMEGAGALLLEALKTRDGPRGRVVYVAGRGPSDLLTLRAARILSEADLVIPDPDADPAILALARRDAGRLAPSEGGAEQMTALAKAGRLVVRIITRSPSAADLAALTRAGVTVDVMLAAPTT